MPPQADAKNMLKRGNIPLNDSTRDEIAKSITHTHGNREQSTLSIRFSLCVCEVWCYLGNELLHWNQRGGKQRGGGLLTP